MSPALVEVSGLTRHYPPSTQALDRVDLSIEMGERVAITGPSGSGKSTLLAILGLLDTPTSGDYRLAGADTAGLGPKQRTGLRRDHIGFVFQAFHLISHLTALENVALALEIKHTPHGEARTQASAALESVGLAHRLEAMPNTLSGGEQQRVAIARALAARPSLLLCDEPTGNLDSASTGQVLDLLLGEPDSTTIIIVTHETDVAARCDRTISMLDGKVVGA